MSTVASTTDKNGAMDLSHQFRLPASIDEVWAAVNHPELVAPAFPGATISSVDGSAFIGEVKVKLGTTTLGYTGTGTLLQRVAGHRRTLIGEAEGFDRRGQGSLSVTATTTLSGDQGSTSVELVLACRFSGRPAQLAPEVVEDAGTRLLEQFAAALVDRFRQGLGAEALAADAGESYRSPLGQSSSSASARSSFSPLENSARTDYEVFRAVAPVWARRFGPPLAGGLALVWLLRRRSTPRSRQVEAAATPVLEADALPTVPRVRRRR